MKAKIEKLISKIDLMVLGLVLEKPMHGYEINQIISLEEMQSWLDISRTSIYYALTRLKKQGLITEVVEKQYNKPDRSVYRITEAGRELFFESLALSLAEQEKVFLEYNVGLFFINKLAKEKAVDVLEERKQFLNKWHLLLHKQLKQAQESEGYSPTLKAVIDHTLSFAENEALWLDTFLADIESDSSSSKHDAVSVFSLSGGLANAQLADVVRMVASGERTGTLALKHGIDAVTISFVEGEVHYITVYPDPSGELVPISPSGDVIIPVEVLKAFNWPEGSFTFTPDQIINNGGVAVRTDSCSLIISGCRMVDNWNRIKKVVPSNNTIYGVNWNKKVPHNNMGLNDEEKTVLAQINGVRNVERLAEACSMSIFEVSRVLYTFVICGLVMTVSADKGEVFGLLKLLSDALFERLFAVKAEKIAIQIEEDLNHLSIGRKIPFLLKDFRLVDSSSVEQDLKEFVDMAEEFYIAQVKAIRSQLGSRFTHHIIESIIGQLEPEMYEIYNRYGFNKTSEL